MIVNVIAVDPDNDQRILQYRVPENSREMQVLIQLFDMVGIDHTTLARKPRAEWRRRRPK